MKHSIFGLATIFSLLFVPSALFVGCANEEMDVENPVTSHSIPVNFHATLTAFDANQVPDTRATALTWKDGDVIYLQYTASDNSNDKAILTYSAGEWTISYEKNFKRDASTKCVAYYFDGDYSISDASITLSPTTGVYADLDATYVYPLGGELTITCNLIPQTSRIRFRGTAGTIFSLEDLSCIAGVNAKSGSVTKSSAANTFTAGSDGYSPYIYGNFASSTQPELMVSLGHYAYKTDCRGLGMLVAGESGFLDLPTPDHHNGWVMTDKNKTFTANGISFNMVHVEAGTFLMGSSTGNSDDQPVHNVTFTKPYYIGETEVTQALWEAVTGYSPTSGGSAWSSSYGLGDNYPAYNISYEDVQNFLTKLNQLTGQQFRMPTEAEWEFAAKGGNYSMGYTYSGSNAIGNVAWYVSNSDSKSHPVKTKAPNELGIYDMSGNVWEWCSDWYGSYSSTALTDPIGETTGSHRVYRGGCYSSGADKFRCTFRNHYTSTYRSSDLGFRLAL